MPTTIPTSIPNSLTEPSFGVSAVPADLLYAPVPFHTDPKQRWKPHSTQDTGDGLIEIWRIEERNRVAEGIGIISSRASVDLDLGTLEGLKLTSHLTSNYDTRNSNGNTTPFVSFTTTPEYFAGRIIAGHGFGVRGGRDSVVVRAEVKADRLANGFGGVETLLWGGLSPGEYISTHEVEDFVKAYTDAEDVTDVVGAKPMTIARAMQHWRQGGDYGPKT